MRPSSARAPFLRSVRIKPDPPTEGYPFNLPWVKSLDLSFDTAITVIVGENGSGKSTLLEALAESAGFGTSGGARDHHLAEDIVHRSTEHELDGFVGDDREKRLRRLRELRHELRLTDALRCGWLPKVGRGFFFRAETFHALARYLDQSSVMGLSPRGRAPEHLRMSHAEGFIDFFSQRFEQARRAPSFFVFDEPESALSPARQLEFLSMIRDLTATGQAQVIIATHSPLLMACPGAELWRMDRGGIEETRLEETKHFRLYAAFVADPAGFVRENMEVEQRMDDEEQVR